MSTPALSNKTAALVRVTANAKPKPKASSNSNIKQARTNNRQTAKGEREREEQLSSSHSSSIIIGRPVVPFVRRVWNLKKILFFFSFSKFCTHYSPKLDNQSIILLLAAPKNWESATRRMPLAFRLFFFRSTKGVLCVCVCLYARNSPHIPSSSLLNQLITLHTHTTSKSKVNRIKKIKINSLEFILCV